MLRFYQNFYELVSAYYNKHVMNRWMIENYQVEMICVVLPGKTPVYG